MGVVDSGKPKFRVAHRFHLPYSTLHSNYHHIKMKSFIVLICVGMAIAGDDMFGHEKMKKQWTDYKAMESCFGEDMMKMMMKKMFEGELEEPRVDYYKMSPFGNMKARMDSGNKYEMMEQMMKTFMNRKNKRAADDVFELGDRLTEKLKQETVKMQAKLGNASRVLQELGIIDQNQDLDVSAMKKSVEDGEWGEFPDQWLKEHNIKDCQNCATYADSIPKPVFDECAYGEKWGRIILFFQCEKE